MNGAKLIHVDPRFTRTSAVADIYAPIRAGSDAWPAVGISSWGRGLSPAGSVSRSTPETPGR